MFWNKKESKQRLPDLPPVKYQPNQQNLDLKMGDNLDSDKHSLPSFPDSPMSKGFSQSAIKEAVTDSQPKQPQMSRLMPEIPEFEENKQIVGAKPEFKTVEVDEQAQEMPEETMRPSIASSPSKQIILEEPPMEEEEVQRVPQKREISPSREMPATNEFSQTKEVIRSIPQPIPEQLPPISRPIASQVQRIQPIAVPSADARSTDIFVKIEKFRTARRSLYDIKERLNDIDETLKKIREVRLREEQELTGWEKELAMAKAQIENVTSNIFEKVN